MSVNHSEKTPVHIITGFLGVGKTSCIQNLIAQKPENERWAVLVNEYGQQGIDGQLFDDTKVTVKQVAGGCACCDALLTFQTTLNELIRFQHPDRIIIEPSGLGHVDNIVKRLQEEDYQQRLYLNGVTCVLDPRHLAQPKYRYHELYLRQLNAADILVANKCDMASEQDLQLFESQFHHGRFSAEQLFKVQHAQISLDMIAQPWQSKQGLSFLPQDSAHFNTQVFDFAAMHGSIDAIQAYLTQLKFFRIKALLVKGDEVYALNISDTESHQQIFKRLHANQSSVVECIHDEAIDCELIQKQLARLMFNE